MFTVTDDNSTVSKWRERDEWCTVWPHACIDIHSVYGRSSEVLGRRGEFEVDWVVVIRRIVRNAVLKRENVLVVGELQNDE